MLRTDVLVSHLLRFVFRLLQDFAQAAADNRLRAVGELWQALELGFRLALDLIDVYLQLAKNLWDQSISLVQQSD